MAAARRPIVTLTTDFGTADHYVAAMKGVILSLAPGAVLVDISHDVAPHDVMEAGWLLRQACFWFPAGTVHVAVTDPGVGTARRPLLAAAGGHWFVGPDNGIFSWVFAARPPREVRELAVPRRAVSATFHGRDIFAPAAARLAAGARPATLGARIRDWRRVEIPRPERARAGAARARVIHVDRFGNVILGFTRSDARALTSRSAAARLGVAAGRRRVTRFVTTYAEIPSGGVAMLFGSSDFLELAANQARADRLLGLALGDQVRVILSRG